MLRNEKVKSLAEFIWSKANELDYDPIHPLFSNFEDPLKDEILALSEKLISKTSEPCEGCNTSPQECVGVKDCKRLAKTA